jgi:2-dehydro-3-deoxygalactonokinase
LVPGLLRAGAEFPDVMRGEETQILGDLAAGRAEGRRCYVLPGTHSKWAWCEGGRIARFATYMTGEVYDTLARHSILGRLMAGSAADDAAFGRGLEQADRSAAAAPGRLLHDLFSARTLGLTAALQPEALASYLSGLLIGAEVRAATAAADIAEVTILGSGTLAPLYARAAVAAGLRVVVGETDTAARGLHAIACAAGLVRETADA